MSRPFNDYVAGPSCSDSAHWHSPQNVSYDYQSPYDFYSSGARAVALGESGSTSRFPDSATFSPSYDYAYSPEADMFPFDDYESSSPISPSCSTSSSSSSCSDAPITPCYKPAGGLPLPPVPLLYTGLDAPPVDEKYQECVSPVGSVYGYEGWDEDTTQTYSSVPESRARPAAAHPAYDSNGATLWPCEGANAYFDASPTSAPAPAPDRPIYATYPSSDFAAVTSAAVSPQHAHTHTHAYPSSSSHPPVSCLSPALLSCPPLKLHQPQPRRSIPVISLSTLASASSEDDISQQPSVHFARTAAASPTLSPLELQFPPSHDACMTSYSALPSSADALPIAAYPLQCPCLCPECTDPYSIS
ncbi:hypothetical protein MVEN_01503900 [Mycena venus]|uniref:Uncharacterized protein n=1 Tax=Mycena venus TaxID=2733690 RepID=A0A8H6XUL1_9AGAR|nr:hypothetical protein MVEN_01503900 [Mycena venus]